MRTDKSIAIQLRKRGRSYTEISRATSVPKSTLSFWLSDIVLSHSAQEKIQKKGRQKSVRALIRRNKDQTTHAKQKAQQIREYFAKQIGKISQRDLFMMGIALYWGEGYKKGAEGSLWKCVDFTNSDPDMIRMMMRFFREICHVKEKDFRIQLAVHSQKQRKKALEYWQKIIGVPATQFIATSIVRSSASRGKQKRYLTNGTVHVRVYRVDLFHTIIGFIDGLKAGCSSVG
ncbi:MAG: hypothetical protein WCW16_02110 [Candidatus Magasanikbacteria bacterium]